MIKKKPKTIKIITQQHNFPKFQLSTNKPSLLHGKKPKRLT